MCLCTIKTPRILYLSPRYNNQHLYTTTALNPKIYRTVSWVYHTAGLDKLVKLPYPIGTRSKGTTCW
jgi:hypothetical protein